MDDQVIGKRYDVGKEESLEQRHSKEERLKEHPNEIDKKQKNEL